MQLEDNSGTTAATPEEYTLLKGEAVRYAGLNPDAQPPQVYAVPTTALRYHLATYVLGQNDFGPEEQAILLKSDLKHLDDATFRGLIRRAQSGVRVMPTRFLAALREGKLLRYGAIDGSLKKLGELEKVDSAHMLGKITDGYQVLFVSELQLKKVAATWTATKKPVKVLMAAAWTPERVALHAAIESRFTPAKLAAILPFAKVAEDNSNLVVAKFGYAEIPFDFGTAQIMGQTVLKHMVCLGTEIDVPTVMGLYAMGLNGAGITTQSSAEAVLRSSAPSTFAKW